LLVLCLKRTVPLQTQHQQFFLLSLETNTN
jgi:hypothetical protein